MLPPRPDPRRDKLEKRVSGAFAMLKGGGQPGAAPAPEEQAESGAEGMEDEALDGIERSLDQACEGVAKLRAIQQKEKGDGMGGDKIEDDSTGSPSMQGMP